jgi:proline iminopeptidase
MAAPALFPPIEPHTTGRLKVDNVHEIYWERSGNPKGVPVVFTHGGPGGRLVPDNRRNYDPDFFDIIAFDQRGTGKSSANGSLEANTTAHILADYERIRQAMGVEKWLVTGGSWSSFMSLHYAQNFPERCHGLVIRGIFTGGDDEVDWWWNGQKNMFPERWWELASFIPEAERGDLLRAYHRRALDPDPAVHLPAARALATYSCFTIPFREDPSALPGGLVPEACIPLARFWTDYCVNKFYVRPNQLLDGVAKIRHLPCAIVQGRYDQTTRPFVAWKLKQAWPEAEFTWVLEAGHKSIEPTIAAAITAATERMKDRLLALGVRPRA